MNLYQIDGAILDCVDVETGEIIDAERLDELQIERQRKIENIALWYKNLMSDAAALKAEEQAFKARREAAEKKAEQLKNYLAGVLSGNSFKSDRALITWRVSAFADIQDATRLPNEYLLQQEPKINKAAILKALKAGEDVAGAALGQHNNITIK